MSNVYITQVMSVFVVAILATQGSVAWRLDCSKFVFAPKCRGVAAKRSQETNDMNFLEGTNFIRPSFHDIQSRLASKASMLPQGQDDERNVINPGKVFGLAAEDWLSRTTDEKDNIADDDDDVLGLLRALKLSDKQIFTLLYRLSQMKEEVPASVSDNNYDRD